MKIYYTRNNVTLTLKLDGGALGTQTGTATITGRYGSTYKIETPSKTGYTFANWSSTLPAKLEAGTYTAIYTANTNTKYTVEHYQQNIDDDDYAPLSAETETKFGTTDSQTSAVAKSYDGFTAKSVTQTSIAAAGTSVVKIYYDRNTITYTFVADGGNWSGSIADQTVSGKYGAAVTAPSAPTKMGYTFKEWSGTSSVPATFGASPLTFTATYTANTNTVYKVEHWQQNIVDDGYTLVLSDTETKTGTTGSQTNVVAKSYDGFKAQPVTQGTINADGSTTVIVKYNRVVTTYTFKAAGGNWNNSTEDQTVNGKFGATVTVPEAPAKTGYTFSAWTGTVSVPETFGTETLTFTASYTANTDTAYKVEHYQQNANDDEYTLVATDYLTGTTAEQTAAAAKTYEHFNAGTVTQSKIAADGSTVVRIEYDRDIITYTFKADGGNWNGNTTDKIINGRYGANVGNITPPDYDGHSFEGWNESIPLTFGIENKSFTAKWTSASIINVNVISTDINVTKTTLGNSIIFASEKCDSYSWILDDEVIGTEQNCVIDVLSRNKGTYSICLEAQKDGKWYSYFAQIKVVYYEASASTAASIIRSMKESGIVSVTGELNSQSIRNINSALKGLKSSRSSVLVSLDLSQTTGLTELENADNTNSYNSFYKCVNLKDIVLPDSVTSIGNNAFNGCKELANITIPDGVTSIENNTFSGCEKLKSITIPDGVTSIGKSAFSSCRCLTNITIPDGVISIGEGAFNDCRKFTNIKIPDGITSIENSVFSGCSSLESITIPDRVISIGNNAFSGCYKLASITIPNSVTNIGNYAFSGIKELTSITIPDGITSIGEGLFYGCEKLTSITIPDSVTSIGSGAFGWCEELTTITIPDSVTSIGAMAFNECIKLKSINIPNGVMSIEAGIFYHCFNLTSITIPDSVTSIGVDAFYCCYSLTQITIPDSVTSIGDEAFWCCEKLTDLIIPDRITNINKSVFYGCNSLTNITIPNGVTSIGSAAFGCCEKLTSITIPASVTSIGNCAFITCSNLSNIIFEATSNWKAGSTNIDSEELSNSATAATYLTNTYKNYNWTRN